jgi:hypothetical protein
MSLSVAAANSALQRARDGLQAQLGPHRLEWAPPRATAAERRLLDGLAAACG